jgi:hypothetical protein
VPGSPQPGRGRSQAERLMAQVIRGDQQDPQSAAIIPQPNRLPAHWLK